MTEPPKTRDRKSEFVENLEALAHEDRGKLAALRRAAGDRWADRTDLLWLVGTARGTVQADDIAFLVATLFAQYSAAKIAVGAHRLDGNFGDTWRLAIGREPSKSIVRRFHLLLDSDLTPDGGGDLPYRLRQMVRYAVSKGVGVNWGQLYYDISLWNHPEHFVQKKWATHFFDPGAPISESYDE